MVFISISFGLSGDLYKAFLHVHFSGLVLGFIVSFLLSHAKNYEIVMNRFNKRTVEIQKLSRIRGQN